MTSLRAEIDRIIDQHFEPSTLGRIQAVDEIMAAVDASRPRVTAESLAGPVTSGQVISDGRETFISVINQDPPPSPMGAILQEYRRRQSGRRRGW